MSYYDLLNKTPVKLSPRLRKYYGLDRKEIVTTKPRKKGVRVNKKIGMFKDKLSKNTILVFETCYKAGLYLDKDRKGTLSTTIANALKKYRYCTFHGYVWRYLTDDGAIEKNTKPLQKLRRRVGQFDIKTGELVKIWKSEHAAKTQVSQFLLHKCLCGKIPSKITGGFLWRYLD